MWIGGDIGKNTSMSVLITYQTPHDRITLWLCWPMGDRMWFSWYDWICVACSLCRCPCPSVVLYSSGDCCPVTMLVGTRSSRRSSSRTEYVAVLMVRVRARRWSRLLDVDWKETALATDMENRPDEEVRLGGGSDEVWRESCVITCIYRNSPWTCIGEPLYSNKPAITRYYVFLLSYLPSESLLHFRNMHFRWQNPFRKVFLTIRKMVRNIFLPVRMTISGTRISVPLSPQVLRHAGST